MFYIGFMTNARDQEASKHHVIRHLEIVLLPEAGGGRLQARDHAVQILADDVAMNDLASLNLGRRVDRSNINPKLLKGWLTACESQHSASCTLAPKDFQSKFALRLIDTQDRCIVTAKDNQAYLALSYVWGDPNLVQHLKLIKETSKWLFTRGALSDSNPAIPYTIKDALNLTKQLGERFIWIDALWIQQDNDQDKQRQIPHMDKIYGCAKLTIVAGTGSDAWAGLTGVGPRENNRISEQLSCTVQGLTLITCLESYHQWRLGSPWETRGWTFQEKALSARLLILGPEQAYFQCKSDLWYEDITCESFDKNIISKTLEVDNYEGGRPFTRYELFLGHFVYRKFGDPSDILNAFRGLENVLSPDLSLDFHMGLPCSMFDAAIGWIFPYHYPHRRRERFPSWSWAGWDFSDVWRGYAFRYLTFRTVGREVLWYRMCEQPLRFQEINSSLPQFVTKDADHLEYTPKSQQTSVPDSPPRDLSIQSPSHILRFWTWSAYLKVDRERSEAKADYGLLGPSELANMQENVFVNIRGAEDEIIGHMRLHRDWRSKQPDRLGFVVTSRYCPYYPTDMGPDGYYVLLIEWKGDIAHRVQVPERSISKEAWERSKPEWKLITLG